MSDYRQLGHYSPDQIRQLEQISYNALPALHTYFVDGWVVRLAKGYTRRANSVNPIYMPAQDGLLDQIRACEAFFTSQNQDAIFKLTRGIQPPHLEAVLDELDYQPPPDHTLVQVASLTTLELSAIHSKVGVQIDTDFNPTWFEAYAQLNNLPDAHRPTMRQILETNILLSGFIRLEIDHEVVAVALGVCEGDYMGIFDVVVVETQRRQGLGNILIRHLMHWGKIQGANTAYLQVVGHNYPAQALYKKYGFKTAYTYWYRGKQKR